MAKRTRRGGRVTPKGTRPQPARPHGGPHGDPTGGHDLPPFVVEVRDVLADESPFGLLALASSLIEATTARPVDRWARGDERPDGPTTFTSFVTSGWPEMQMLALAVATMHPDELLARRLRTSIDTTRLDPAPRWLDSMDTIEITETFTQADPLGDGENVGVAWTWPDGSIATAIVYVDHNLGTIAKDAFVVTGQSMAELMDELGPGDRIVTTHIPPADARARIAQAIVAGEQTMLSPGSDSWPSSRPMIEWVLRHLPAGGTGYTAVEWSDRECDELVGHFMSSAEASSICRVAGITAGQLRELATELVTYASGDVVGDPLRWSPVTVEIVLREWARRGSYEIRHLPHDVLLQFPDVMAAFVRYAHARRGIPDDLTEMTVAAIHHWRRVIDGGLDDDFDVDDVDDFDDFDDHDGYMATVVARLEDGLISMLGSRAAYDTLDDAPLGDVPIGPAGDWSTLPEPVRAATIATAELIDRWATEWFDPEVRTIARHVLAAVVRNDLVVFKRSPRVDALAAGIVWFVHTHVTDRLSPETSRQLPWRIRTQKDLAAATGVSASTIGARARTVSNVVERAAFDWTKLLHSSQRHQALIVKHEVADWRAAH